MAKSYNMRDRNSKTDKLILKSKKQSVEGMALVKHIKEREEHKAKTEKARKALGGTKRRGQGKASSSGNFLQKQTERRKKNEPISRLQGKVDTLKKDKKKKSAIGLLVEYARRSGRRTN